MVDVGVRMGHTTLILAEHRNDLQYVVQDRPAVIEQAEKFWNDNLPEAVADGTVSLMPHDFFTEQPVKGAEVYLLRMICHDYGKMTATSILRHIHDAANEISRLLLVDQVVSYACNVSDEKLGEIPGAQQILPPPPLLTNLGKSNAIANLGDFQMFCVTGGEERTLGSWIDLTEAAGWKIVQIFPIPGSLHQQILAVPV